ncbi:alpha/beta fold hydrolase [Nonomuraea sp. B12E4]|uniref:thioesterase II family protein n=1 Tax=Nonomuraea sp. B12E4 TaxID=3153564 RepID=UPI00325CFAB5
MKLVCFPPAGGSAASFRAWRDRLGLPVHVIDRRGRGDGSLLGLAAELAPEVASGQPYALVGHSLGGLLAYEIAARVGLDGSLPRPDFVLVVGSRPPHHSSAAVFAPLLALDDDAMLDALARMGAVHPMLRTSPLRHLFTPSLRADLRLIAGYHPDLDAGPLPVDLVAWHGTEDRLATPALGREWSRYTRAGFELVEFAGGHFFPQDRLTEVATALHARLSPGGSTTLNAPPSRR